MVEILADAFIEEPIQLITCSCLKACIILVRFFLQSEDVLGRARSGYYSRGSLAKGEGISFSASYGPSERISIHTNCPVSTCHLQDNFASGSFRVLRILRLARSARGLRIVRLLRFIRPLRLLVFSIAITLKSLASWIGDLC